MVSDSLFSSKSDDWPTPENLMSYINDKYGEMFDPCPLNFSFDGLNIDWEKFNYVNPPYSEIEKWIEKSYSEYLKNKFVCLLIPARTDTKYFHEYIIKCQEIYFIKGRLKFGESKNSAPFPSIICIFNPSIKNNSPELKTLDLNHSIKRKEKFKLKNIMS